ncbi:non-ribosomal peptide synthetase [Kibdelosporangium persicum]|uniref:Linear gramicidin synthase subunit D n=1 Tax=Kibdelosporangium persicum TaxID=2698649 RepID=A0ABX2FHR4_9PSEU|nr:non-ribosomal peptide synthetase [Kibdelosporangium persicum]NRN70400.1 Linear gramicidin synthase subunit D [Kibdelosporangium persicum]
MDSCAMDGAGRAGVPRKTSFAQQRLWFLDQLRPGSADYLLPLALRLRGELDTEALAKALSVIIDRHEVLRTRFGTVDGEPRQLVDESAGVRLETVVVRDPAEFIRQEIRRPVDLAVAPPLRAKLACLRPDDHLLLLVFHHIAVDGRSWDVLMRELAAAYRGEPLPPLPVQYADFAEWQHERLAGPRLSRELGYWRDRLAGLAPLDLPADRPRPAFWDGKGDAVRFTLAADVVIEVDRFARQHRATRFMVLLAVFKAVLARYTGQTDLAVGAPVAGRGLAGAEKLIGLFVNTVVLRTDLSGRPSFTTVLRRVRDGALAAFSHAEAPFERIVTELTTERDLSRNPLCQASFSLLNAAHEPVALPGLDTELVQTPLPGSPMDLFLDLTLRPGGDIVACLQYATALFDHETMEQFAHGYAELLHSVLAEPDVPVADLARRLKPLPGKQRRRLLEEWNDTGRAVPDLTVSQLFEREALFSPDAIAVRSGDVELTYGQLDGRTNQLAHHLRTLGVGPGTLVGVHLERGADLVVAFLAVLKAGGAYLPIDPGYPSHRIGFVLEDAGARLVITQDSLAARLPAADTVLLDRDSAAIARHPTHGLTGAPGDLAYVIYTSGSTGRPKGVLIGHRALTNFLMSMVDRPGLRRCAAVIALTTVSFDISALELYLPLLVGGQVVVAGTEEARDPLRMAGLIDTVRPAALQATPAYLRMLLDSGWSAPPWLTVLSGGEKLPRELARRLAADGATVWDLYGPTEATVWATTARLDGDGHVVAWTPVANYAVHVLDSRLEPVPVGAVGELHIGGTGLAWGYHNRPGTTAAAFVPDPHATRPGARLYRTGDLARRHENGAVEILGRRDHQVKIRGHRIEPGEIEAALLAHPGINASVVHPAGDRLIAYLTGDVPAPERLRAFLLETLPDYMVPAVFVTLDELPLTPNGKIDRNALPVPDAPASSTVDHVAPRTPAERAVADVWREVLGSPRIGVHENFFEIGGHSLLATRVAVRLRAALGIDVPVRGLFDHGTVAELASALPDYPRMPQQRTVPALTARRRVKN